MAVESTLTKRIYQGNGEAKEFPVPFPYSRAADIRLLHTDAGDVETEITGNFRVNANESGDTSVTYPVNGQPMPVGSKLTVYRATPQTQIVDLVYGGAFSPDTLEHDGLDRLEMQIQELQEEVDRSIRVDISSERTPGELLGDLLEAQRSAAADADRAEDARDSVLGSAEAAASSADAGAKWAKLAQQWAENPEDTPVSSGHFSAYHWYRKTFGLNLNYGVATDETPGAVVLATDEEAAAGGDSRPGFEPYSLVVVPSAMVKYVTGMVNDALSAVSDGYVTKTDGDAKYAGINARIQVGENLAITDNGVVNANPMLTLGSQVAVKDASGRLTVANASSGSHAVTLNQMQQAVASGGSMRAALKAIFWRYTQMWASVTGFGGTIKRTDAPLSQDYPNPANAQFTFTIPGMTTASRIFLWSIRGDLGATVSVPLIYSGGNGTRIISGIGNTFLIPPSATTLDGNDDGAIAFFAQVVG